MLLLKHGSNQEKAVASRQERKREGGFQTLQPRERKPCVVLTSVACLCADPRLTWALAKLPFVLCWRSESRVIHHFVTHSTQTACPWLLHKARPGIKNRACFLSRDGKQLCWKKGGVFWLSSGKYRSRPGCAIFSGWPLAAIVARGPAGLGRRLLPGDGGSKGLWWKATNPELSSARFTDPWEAENWHLVMLLSPLSCSQICLASPRWCLNGQACYCKGTELCRATEQQHLPRCEAQLCLVLIKCSLCSQSQGMWLCRLARFLCLNPQCLTGDCEGRLAKRS